MDRKVIEMRSSDTDSAVVFDTDSPPAWSPKSCDAVGSQVVPVPGGYAQLNVGPFYLKKPTGNTQVGRGCGGSLRLADGCIPHHPYVVVVAHLERRTFRDQSGTLKTPF